jgi:septal ring factor EnvC (AmiA/AmiB activator)
MPTNPFDDVADDERTDELPVLVETVALGTTAPTVQGTELLEDTAERTGKHVSAATDVGSLQNDLAARGARIAALEQDIARLSARWNGVEQQLTARDVRVEELNRTLGELRHTLTERHAAEQHLAAELDRRSTELERLVAENAELRAAANRAEAKRETVGAEPPAPAGTDSTESLRQEIEGLTAYIANRRDWWHEIKSRVTAAADRIDTLQRELLESAAAQREASALAARESARANALRDELVAATRLVEEQRRALAAVRKETGETTPRSDATPTDAAPAAAAAAPAAREPSTPIAPPAGHAGTDQGPTGARSAPPAAAAHVLPAPAFEVLAALEAEVAHKRQQIGAQLVELRDREQRLQASAATIEQLRQDLVTQRTELEETRADVGRLERAVVDKDRALQARDLRIATLQEELNQRLGAIQKLNAMDASLQGLSSKMSHRLRRVDPAADSANVPTLVCLTGDAPKQVPLTRKAMTIGRGQQCDIQILTHFVSREHARITTDRGAVVIEDLASTNGVFVNSVRVDRHELQHGDLLTIGETQFRFLESMAH